MVASLEASLFPALGYLSVTHYLKFAKFRAMMFLAQLEFKTLHLFFFFFFLLLKVHLKHFLEMLSPSGSLAESWPLPGMCPQRRGLTLCPRQPLTRAPQASEPCGVAVSPPLPQTGFYEAHPVIL